MEPLHVLRDFWAIIAAIVAVIVWAVRVEAQMKDNASQIKGLWRQRNEDLEAHQRARSETNDRLSELRDEIRSLAEDIKKLLGRH